MEEASNIDSSHTSSLSKFFDKEMLKEFVTMRDMVQELWEDREESIALQEQLMAMKVEKYQLLEKLHEMETQLHEANETLTKYMHEHEVCNVNLSSNSSQDECFGVYENHTRGIGSKLLLKMGYEGRGLGKHVQGIFEPIVVEERPKYCGLGYEQRDGANSKVEETREKVPRTTFVASSIPPACKACVRDECKCVKQESYDSHADKNIVVGLQKRACNSSNSPSQRGDEGECSRYNSSYHSVDFDYVKHDKFACKNGRKSPCTYCGLYNHHVSKCWKRLTTFSKLYKQRQLEKRMQKICTHCQKRGHLIDQCCTLHPTTHPFHKRQMDNESSKNGRGDSIIDVSQDDSQEEDFQQKKSPLNWLGKKWLDFLSK
jgi:hypothetical protein